MRFPITLALLALGSAACTPAAQQVAITAVEAACVAVVSVEAPEAEPLCVYGGELLAGAVAAGMDAAAASTTRADGRTVVPAKLYTALATKPAIAGRKVPPRCPKPAGGGRVGP